MNEFDRERFEKQWKDATEDEIDARLEVLDKRINELIMGAEVA